MTAPQDLLDRRTILDFIKALEEEALWEQAKQLLEQQVGLIGDELALKIKERASQLSNQDLTLALRLVVSLSYAATLTGRPFHRILALMTEGNAANWQGDNRRAVQLYDQARDLALSEGNNLEAARSQIGKLHALYFLGEHLEAVKVGEAAKAVLLAHRQYAAVCGINNNLGNSYTVIGDYVQAYRVYHEAEEILQHLLADPATEIATEELWNLLAITKYNLSWLSYEQNKYLEALEMAQEATEIEESLGNRLNVALYQNASAFYSIQLGQYNRALRLLAETRLVYLANNMQDYLLLGDLYAALCYLALNNFLRAAEYCESVLHQIKTADLPANFVAGWANHYLALAYVGLDLTGQAMAAFEQARIILETSGSKVMAANILQDQANLHFRLGELARAEELCQQARTEFSGNELSVSMARCNILLGQVSLARQDFYEAEQLAGQALTTGQTAHMPMLIYQALLLLAQAAEARNDPQAGLEYYRQCLAALEELWGRVAAEQRPGFIEDKEVAYQGAVAVALQLGNAQEALTLVERGKSRSLVDLLAGELDVRVKIRTEDDRELVAELEQWRTRRNELIGLLNRFGGQPLLNQDNEVVAKESLLVNEREQLAADLHETEKQLSRGIERLQVRNSAYAEDLTLQPTLPRFDPAQLDEATTLVEYYICRDQLLAFVVDRQNGTRVVTGNLISLKNLKRLLTKFRLNLSGMVNLSGGNIAGHSSQIAALNQNVRAVLGELYNGLIAPLVAEIRPSTRMVVVPHGMLHYLPFPALYNSATQKYLLEEWEEISYLPSSSLLELCTKRGNRQSVVASAGSYALVAGYSSQGELSYCLEEARTVGRMLQQSSQLENCLVFLEEAASLAQIEKQAGLAALIHLASHARLRQDNPYFSALELAGGELTAQDIFNMELRASLVTLSACETGLGGLGSGDELLGLSRACLYAGASSLVLSLWKVQDESVSRLFDSFYRRLLTGQRKAAALRNAQIELLNQEAYAHPFFWAAFTLTGHAGNL